MKDRVADNLGKYEITESESLLFGENFGVTPDLKESPDGTLYVVSSTQGNVYEIRRESRRRLASMRGRASRQASSPKRREPPGERRPPMVRGMSTRERID